MKKQLLTILTIAVLAFTANAQDFVLQFDEVNSQRVKYTTSASDILDTKLNGATDYTIEVWVRPTQADIHNNTILKRWDQFAITLYDTERFYFTRYKDLDTDPADINRYVNTLPNVITLNEWNHLVVICDSAAGTIKLYVNGVDVTDDTETASQVVLKAAPSGGNFYIGEGGFNSSYYTGHLDKIRIKNTAELIGNLQTNINDTPYITDADTAILYNFDEGTGDVTVNDADGLNADLLCVSAACVGGETYWVDLSVLAVSQNNLIDFNLYPNPVTEKVFSIQANESIKNVQLFDVLGKSVKTVEVSERATQLNIDVNDLSQGIYFVKTTTDAGIGTQKIIVQ